MKHFHSSEDNLIHVEAAHGDDLFLCGFAMEGENGTATITETKELITCQMCATIIQFCRKIKLGEISPELRK